MLGPVDFGEELANVAGVPTNNTPGIDGFIASGAFSGPIVYNQVSTAAGKYLTGAKSGNGQTINLPFEGLISWNATTLELNIKCDTAWNDPANDYQGLFAFGEYFYGFRCQFDATSSRILFIARFPGYETEFSTPCTSAAFNAGVWVNLVLTFNSGTVLFYINETLTASLTNFPTKFLAGSTTVGDGLQLGGYNGQILPQFTFSDLRIIAAVRVPGSVYTPSVGPTITVNKAGSSLGTINQQLRGALHYVPNSYPSAQALVPAALGGGFIRTDKVITACPISTTQNSTTPTQMPSPAGAFFWNPQPLINLLNFCKTSGVGLYLSCDSNTAALGGANPFSDTYPYANAINVGMPGDSAFDTSVPSNMQAWANIYAGIISYWHTWYLTNGGAQPQYVGWGNEPDLGDFWTGTQLQAMQLYALWYAAVRALGISGLKIGGLDFSDAILRSVWLTGTDGLLPYGLANGCFPDFVSYHDYYGISMYVDEVGQLIETWMVANNPSGSLEVLVGEGSWTLTYAGGGPQPMGSFIGNFYNGGWAAAYNIRKMIRDQSYSTPHITRVAKRVLLTTCSTDLGPATTASALITTLANVTSNYNAYRMWKSMLPTIVSQSTNEEWPGVTHIASTDGTGITIIVPYLKYRTDYPATLTINLPGVAAGSVVTRQIVGYDGITYRSDWVEGATQTLETRPSPSVDGGSVLTVTIWPRSVSLFQVPMTAGGSILFIED